MSSILFFLINIHDNFVRMDKIKSSSNSLSILFSLFKLGIIYSKVYKLIIKLTFSISFSALFIF